jgi:hypothetical protein
MQRGTILSVGAITVLCGILVWQKYSRHNDDVQVLDTIVPKDPMQIRDPLMTIAPTDEDSKRTFYDEYKDLIPQEILQAIQDINEEASMRDECNERKLLQPNLETLKKGSGFHRQLTHEESTKIAGMAVDSLNETLKVPRLTIMDIQQGLKVHPSGHILVPFIIHDVITLSSIKLVVTLMEMVPECENDRPKHAIVQILPYNQIVFNAVVQDTLPKHTFACLK